MAEWQTRRTQNAVGNPRVGSSPTFGTSLRGGGCCLRLLLRQGPYGRHANVSSEREQKGDRLVSERLLAIDGMSLLNRAFHALPPLTAPDGTPTGAIHGFFLTFMKWYDAYKPTHVAIAFDRPGGTFRHQQFERYKAHRKEADPALIRQFPLAEKLLGEMGIEVIGIPGFEADDVLGTITERFAGELPVTVISGDRDLLQLVGGRCEIVLMRALDGTKRYDPETVS